MNYTNSFIPRQKVGQVIIRRHNNWQIVWLAQAYNAELEEIARLHDKEGLLDGTKAGEFIEKFYHRGYTITPLPRLFGGETKCCYCGKTIKEGEDAVVTRNINGSISAKIKPYNRYAWHPVCTNKVCSEIFDALDIPYKHEVEGL